MQGARCHPRNRWRTGDLSQLTFDSHSGATDTAMHRDARAGLPPRPSVVQKYLDIIAAVSHSQVTAVAALCSKDAAKGGVAVSVKLLGCV